MSMTVLAAGKNFFDHVTAWNPWGAQYEDGGQIQWMSTFIQFSLG
jgi:hypothetical protein